jgi:4'-phosphopantetheinyl transferase
MRPAEPLRLSPATPRTGLLDRWQRDGHVVVRATTGCWGAGRTGSRRLIRETLRALLGRDTGLARDRRGRPYPVDARTGARLDADLNLAHTDDVLLLGVRAGGGRIGVDVERVDRRIGLEPGMLAKVCHPGERAALAWTEPAERPGQLVRLWTRKEAVAKADGRGLALGLATLDVTRPAPGRSVTSVLHDGYWTSTALLAPER